LGAALALLVVLVLRFRRISTFLVLLFSFRILGDDARNNGHLLTYFLFEDAIAWFEAYLLFRALLGLGILVRLLVGHDDDMILLVAGSFWWNLDRFLRRSCRFYFIDGSCFLTPRSLLSDSSLSFVRIS
jgi:hypothetical protein